MAVSYGQAIDVLQDEARRHNSEMKLRTEQVPIELAINRISGDTVSAPQSTPLWDTSAMDGYSLSSKATKHASVQSPISFPVGGLIAAGKEPVLNAAGAEGHLLSCVEIMTGARFPDAAETGDVDFDCCVKFEDVKRIRDATTGQISIQVSKPASYRQNRRSAGGDFQKGQVVVTAGEIIRPRHIMALASVGIKQISVQPKLQIGLYSTGSELLSHSKDQPNKLRIEDINGPYIATALADSTKVEVHFLGTLDDKMDTISTTIMSDMNKHRYNLIITTGAVSAGRFDLIPPALEKMGATILFHRLGMRPGHPALFASIPCKSPGGPYEVPFFGLPGNPVASAACLRFLVMPFICFLQSGSPETPLKARLTRTENEKGDLLDQPITNVPHDKDVFRPGILSYNSEGKTEVLLISDHSPGKVRPFLEANCWIHFHNGPSEAWEGDYVDVFPGV